MPTRDHGDEPSEEPAVDRVIGGRVRLVRPLASGAMGSVWIGHHLALDVEVAVKFIRPELFTRDPHARRRFEREAQAAARIKSPHVVQTFDRGLTDSGSPYLVMELLEGETLRSRIERGGPLDEADVVAIVEQVGRALDRAHSLGIVHRDVKPENIFLTQQEPRPFVKLLDFGIAKLTEVPVDHAATQTGVVVGTPQYMSPEQLLRPKEADHRGDLWALAVVTYHALAAVAPFVGETLAALIVSITQAKFARIRSHRPELPAAADAWFERALDVEPEARFASGSELTEALASALGIASGLGSARSRKTAAEAHDEGAEAGEGGTEDGADAAGSSDTAAFVADHGLGIATLARAGDRERDSSTTMAPGVPALRDETLPSPEPSSHLGPPAHGSTALDEALPSPGPSAHVEPPAAGSTALDDSSEARTAPNLPADLEPKLHRAAQPEGAVPVQRARRGSTWIVLAVVVALAAAWIGTRWRAAPSGASTNPSAASTVTSPTTIRPETPDTTAEAPVITEEASARGAPRAPAIPPTNVVAGTNEENGAWLAEFKVARYAGDEGRSWLEAFDACRERGAALCTETQWTRACEQLPALGRIASWTSSASGERGFVVRGGAGCTARSVVAGGTLDGGRVGVCCGRGVALRSESASSAFRQSVAARLLTLERALDRLDVHALGELFAPEVDLGGKPAPQGDVIARLRKQAGYARDRSSLHDVCDVRLTTFEGDPGWTADCRVLVRLDDRVGYVERRYVYGGPDGKLRVVAEPKVYRMPAELREEADAGR